MAEDPSSSSHSEATQEGVKPLDTAGRTRATSTLNVVDPISGVVSPENKTESKVLSRKKTKSGASAAGKTLKRSSYVPPHVPASFQFVPEGAADPTAKTHATANEKKPRRRPSCNTSVPGDTRSTVTGSERGCPPSHSLVSEHLQPLALTVGNWGSRSPDRESILHEIASRPQLPLMKHRPLRRYEVSKTGLLEEHIPDPTSVNFSRVVLKDHLQKGGTCDHSALFGGMDRYNSLDADDESNRHRLSAPDVDPDALVYKYPRLNSPKLNVTSDAPLKPILEFNAIENLGKAKQDDSSPRDYPSKPQLPALAHTLSPPPELTECSSLPSVHSILRTPKGGSTQPSESADNSEQDIYDMNIRGRVFQDSLRKAPSRALIRLVPFPPIFRQVVCRTGAISLPVIYTRAIASPGPLGHFPQKNIAKASVWHILPSTAQSLLESTSHGGRAYNELISYLRMYGD